MISQNQTPRSEQLHIGIFGRRNAGKSSLLNAITGQEIAVVSPTKGTTTDPVYKAMELLPIGPVVLIDTPGIDDVGDLGALRIEKTKQILRKTDIALLVVDTNEGFSDTERKLTRLFEKSGVKYLTIYNETILSTCKQLDGICVNPLTGENIEALKEAIAQIGTRDTETRHLVADLLSPGDFVILVTPIDESAPKGRLILPQQQVIRDVLEAQAVPILTQTDGLPDTLQNLRIPPRLVITDSQVFGQAAKHTPETIPLTSFSILMARYKGVLAEAVRGARVLDTIRDGDQILIAEGCTHHRQCEDIGTVKLPMWIEAHTGTKPRYTFTSGGDFPGDLTPYKLIIHCGGCMLNAREMHYRGRTALEANIPMTNYGIAISHMQGILSRATAPLEL